MFEIRFLSKYLATVQAFKNTYVDIQIFRHFFTYFCFQIQPFIPFLLTSISYLFMNYFDTLFAIVSFGFPELQKYFLSA